MIGMFPLFLVACGLSLSSASVSAAGPNIELNTTRGLVRGRIVDSAFVFQGIPYVQAPVGNRRFMPPVEMEPWKDVKGMNQYSSWCPQLTNLNVSMSEDCLYINVFSPAMNTSNLFPVLVWIHGGGYVTGSGNRFPVASVITQIVQKGIVMVTFNYRLNAFGFFSTHTSDIVSNLGMLDQVKALVWVNREVKNFGGDPSRVTIDGESAGGASVSLHTYSKLSRGYFSQVIMQSGTALTCWAVDGLYSHSTASRDLSIDAGCTTKAQWEAKQLSGLLKCLQNKTWKALLEIQHNFSLGAWAPVVDGKGGFLEDFPANIKRPANFSVLIGSNHDEMGFFLLDLLRGKKNISQVNQGFFEAEVGPWVKLYFEEEAEPVRQLIDYAYVQSLKFNYTSSASWLHAMIQFISELIIHAGTVAEAKSLLSHNQTVYLYSFDFLSKSLWGSFQYPAVLHFFDVLYLFPGTADGLAWNFTTEDYNISKIFSTCWTNFVIHGNPTPAIQDLPYSWGPLDTTNDGGPLQYLSITSAPYMMTYFHPRAFGFWNILLPQLLPRLKSNIHTSSLPHTTPLKYSIHTSSLPHTTPVSEGTNFRIPVLLFLLCALSLVHGCFAVA